jgi:hypothetical protein
MQLMVTKFVRLALALDSKKIPIQRKDIQTLVTGNNKKRGLVEAIVDQGIKKLEEIFGLTLVKLDGAKKGAATGWILKTKDKTNMWQDENAPQHGFLMLLLGLIVTQMSRYISEFDLWEFLGKLKIEKKTFIDKVGIAEDILDDFVKQMYLTRRNVESTSEEKKQMSVYSVGLRTKAESMDDMLLIHFYEKITGSKTDSATLKEMGMISEDPEPTNVLTQIE